MSEFIRLTDGPAAINAVAWNGAWPPPEELWAANFDDARLLTLEPISDDIESHRYTRVRYSALTDEQAAGMTHVARGAEYEHAPIVSEGA